MNERASGCPTCRRPFAESRGEVRPLSLIQGGRRRDAFASRAERTVSTLDALMAARGRHVYVTGQPGTGKSSLLLQLVLDDLEAGRGACVVDPHGGLVRAVMAACDGREDLVPRLLLFDPADTDYPVGLDILDAHDEPAQDRVVQFMIDLFMTLYLPDQQGPMLHQATRNGLRLLMATGGLLPELPLLFTDRAFVRRRLSKATDPWVCNYFEKVWLPWAESSKSEFLAYLTSKLSHFVEDRILRNILGQRGGLDLRGCMARRRVVLVDLSPRVIGRLNARLLGMLILHKLEQATFEREPGADQFHIYLDDVHELLTPNFPSFLGLAAKCGVGLVMAHQGPEQLAGGLRQAILQGAGSLVCFRQGSGSLGEMAGAFWPRFQERDFLRLPDFEALVWIAGTGRGSTVERLAVLRPGLGAQSAEAKVRETSRRAVAQPRLEVERALIGRLELARGEHE